MALVVVGFATLPDSLRAQLPFIQDGKAGFVVSHFAYALSLDAEETGACPSGMSRNPGEIFAMTPEGKQREEESDQEYVARVRTGGRAVSTASNGQNLCMHPEAGEQDPHFRTVTVPDVPVYGINLDEEDSRVGGAIRSGSCAHNDLIGMDGARGIDNQFFRVVGCSRSFQPSGTSNEFDIGMFAGEWGILLTFDGVDDLHNDEHIEVGIFANADPIQLSPGREPLEYATYAVDQDPRFQATTSGQMRDGILTTEPTSVRFYRVVNSMRLERPLEEARIQATLSEDGVLEGYLAGYTPIEALYDFQFGYRNGKDGTGALAPLRLRMGSSNGGAQVLGFTCHGVYHGLRQLADAHPDPENGSCTSISTQYRFAAIPAFVVDVETQSLNQELDVNPGNVDDY